MTNKKVRNSDKILILIFHQKNKEKEKDTMPEERVSYPYN